MLPKCCVEYQKPGTFQRFSPTFQKLFLKRDLFDSLNGVRCLLVGGVAPERRSSTKRRTGSLDLHKSELVTKALDALCQR